MSPIFVPTLVDLLHVCADLPDDEIGQIAALDFDETYDVERQAVALFSKDGPAFSLRAGNAYCVGGFEPLGPGVARLWMRTTRAGWRDHTLSITRTGKQLIRQLLDGGAIHRVQVMVLASRTAACEWYENGLGLIKEAQHSGYGRNGEDVAIYRLNTSDVGD